MRLMQSGMCLAWPGETGKAGLGRGLYPVPSVSCVPVPSGPSAAADLPAGLSAVHPQRLMRRALQLLLRRLSKSAYFASGTDTAAPGENACNEVGGWVGEEQVGAGCLLQRRAQSSCAAPPCPTPARRHNATQVLNHCYELLAACVRGAEDVSPEMRVGGCIWVGG